MATQPFDDLTAELRSDDDVASAERVLAAVRALIRAFNVFGKGNEAADGVSGAQLEILEQLRHRPATSVGDLAGRTGTDQSTISVLVKRLVAARLVDRATADGDRRRVELTLAPEGNSLLDEAPPTVAERLRRGFLQLAVEERAMLTSLLERWLSLSGLRR